MSAYLAVELEYCRRAGHRFRTAWSDKSPMKVSLICLTCCTSEKTAYAAYGQDTLSWGTWYSRRKEKTE